MIRLEWRVIHGKPSDGEPSEWRLWSKYKTVKRAQQAMDNLQGKRYNTLQQNKDHVLYIVEYRIVKEG